MKRFDYPIIVIGAGAGGLVVAIGAAKAGKKVLLIERGNYGGDCTNFGCIPSKSLIAASEVAHAITERDHYGISASVSSFDGRGALKRAREIVQKIRTEEEPEALKEKGVETLTGEAHFLDSHTVKVNEKIITGKQIILATGSSPNVPPIPGLDQVSYCTNETIFDLEEIPKELVIIGGGPIGCELAQAFQRLGSSVAIIQRQDHLLQKEEPEVQNLMEPLFEKENITLYLGYETKKVETGIKITIEKAGECKTLNATHLLIAAGRKPNIDALKLSKAGVSFSKRGIQTDAYGRTSQKHFLAIGDVSGRAIFTHVAENEARTILNNLLLPWPFKKKIDAKQAIPRVTYTDPEIASCGISEKEAKETYGEKKIAVYTISLNQVDRAITAGKMEGFIKVVTKKWSSRILGATIVSPRAGEMLSEITAAMQHRIPFRKLASLIHPYPTYSLGIRKAADLWLTQTLLPELRKWIKK